METIRVYHSLWKSGLLVAVCFGFTALGIFLINAGKDGIVAWLATSFFGIGGLFMLWLMLPFLLVFAKQNKKNVPQKAIFIL